MSDVPYTEETVELVAAGVAHRLWRAGLPPKERRFVELVLTEAAAVGLLLPPGAVETVEYGALNRKMVMERCCRWADCTIAAQRPWRHTHSRRVFTWPDQPNTPTQLVYGWTPIDLEIES